MASKVYPAQHGPIPVPDLENWNTDREPDVPVMVRGGLYKRNGTWYYNDGKTEKRYHLVAKDLSSDPFYMGYKNSDGNWFVWKLNIDAVTEDGFIYGTSGFGANWTNRATLSYDDYDNIF